VAGEDQRDAREADVAGEDRREAETGERSNDSRHEQMDSCICSEGIRFLEAPWRATWPYTAGAGHAGRASERDQGAEAVPRFEAQLEALSGHVSGTRIALALSKRSAASCSSSARSARARVGARKLIYRVPLD